MMTRKVFLVAAIAATSAVLVDGFVPSASLGAGLNSAGRSCAVAKCSRSDARTLRELYKRESRLGMITGAEAELADSTNLLFAQMAGCTTLISAGYKITWDKGAEGDTEEDGEERASGEVDIFRDTALRYMGYANEVGEAFRPLIPDFVVVLSYAVAIAYVTSDAVAKGFKCAVESDSKTCAVPALFDVLTFQMLASVVFPGFTINRWVAFVEFVLEASHMESQFPGIGTWFPTACGLGLIPFIVAPLDNLVEEVLDRTTRPFLTQKFGTCELEPIFGAEPLP